MDLRKETTKKLRVMSHLDQAKGFTLIEITFAILILASSLIVLLGLQGSVMKRTLRDTNQLQAMLLARRILAAIETTEDPLENQDRSSSAKDILTDFKVLDAVDEDDSKNIERFQAHLVISSWSLPGTQSDSMKRVLLTISWSEDPLDTLNLVYFIPSDVEEDDDDLDLAG